MTKILIVDDDGLIRGVIAIALQAAGYEIMESADGADARNKLETRQFDLVITDSSMPHGGAMPIADYIREKDSSLPVLIVSGGMDEMYRERLEKAGLPMNHKLSKPFKKSDLLNAVQRALRGRS